MKVNVNEAIHDREVSHRIGLDRYSTATVRKIVALLNRVDADVINQLNRNSWDDVVRGAARKARLEKLLAAVRESNTEAYEVVSKALRNELRDLAAYEAEFQEKSLLALDAPRLRGARLVLPKAEELNAAVNARPFQGKLLKDWLKEADEASFRRVRDSVRMSFIEGESVAEAARRIRGTKALQYRDGVLDISRRGAEAMVRTAITHTANAAKQEFHKANSDLIRFVRWSSVLDRRTSPVCRGRDGKVYPVDSGPRPPAHINCRSLVIPELKGEPAFEGKSYDDWLREQPVDSQEDILGITKAKLFRKGELRLDSFVDRAGQEYSLEELRKRESAAFERAGL